MQLSNPYHFFTCVPTTSVAAGERFECIRMRANQIDSNRLGVYIVLFCAEHFNVFPTSYFAKARCLNHFGQTILHSFWQVFFGRSLKYRLEAVRAGIDASKTVRQSQILVSSFPQCCLLLACGCLMLECFSWLPPDCWFGVGLPHRFITYARLLWKPSASVWGMLGSLRYSFCSHTYPRMPWRAIRHFIKRNHCIMLGCVGHSQSQCCTSVGLNRRLPSLFAPKPVTTA